MTKFKFLSLVLVCLTGVSAVTPASAVPCMPTNFATIFNSVNKSRNTDETYWIGYGHLHKTGHVVEITPPDYPKDLDSKDPRSIYYRKSRIYDGEYHGGFLDGNTVVSNSTYNAKVKTICSGRHCGYFPSEDTPMLLMMKLEPQGVSLSMGSCGGTIIYNPSTAQIEAVQTCLRLGICGPVEENTLK